MPKVDRRKFYLGDIIIKGKQVSAFSVSSSKKRAAEIFKCTSNYITSNFEIWEPSEVENDKIFNLALDYPEQLFVSKNTMCDDYRLFLDEERFISRDRLISDDKEKELYLEKAIYSKAKFIKVRLHDKLALENNILVDIYLDITKLADEQVKTFYYIPFNEKLIDESWQHRAIETNHKIETLINEMFDIYDEVIKPYSVNEALDFIKIG